MNFTFDSDLHEYRDASLALIPSTTQVMKDAGLISFTGINAAVLERKRQLGSLVHRVTQLMDEGEDLSQYEIPEEVLPYLEGYDNFCKHSKFELELIEHRVIGEANSMRWGMTLDRTGSLHGEPYVIELKCGASAHPAWGVQLASYDLGLNNIGVSKLRKFQRAAVQLGPQFPLNFKVHEYNDPADYTVWLNSLANMTWKCNKKLYKSEYVPERIEL